MALGVLLEAFFFVFCAPPAAILNNLLTHAKKAFLPLMGNRMRTRARRIRGWYIHESIHFNYLVVNWNGELELAAA